MDQEAFDQSLFLTARLVERGDFVDAAIALRPWLETDLEAKGKAIVCVNLAVCSEHQQDFEVALAWYDHGAHYAPVFALEHKAVLLHRLGRRAEALDVYRGLLPEILSPEERQRIQQNIELLQRGD